jgi:hypothetical protein
MLTARTCSPTIDGVATLYRRGKDVTSRSSVAWFLLGGTSRKYCDEDFASARLGEGYRGRKARRGAVRRSCHLLTGWSS